MIKQVAVIGSGVMGAAIAAHIANSQTSVLLFDQHSGNLGDPNRLVKAAKAKLAKTKPNALMLPNFVEYITPANTKDDLEKLKNCDWVIEAIVEDTQAKADLYQSILPYLSPQCILSSNTSTIPLATLCLHLPDERIPYFFITHFFNPPRYMSLLELIHASSFNSNAKQDLSEFLTLKLGKTIIHCLDTPGFIANRIGTYWLHRALTLAIEYQLDFDQADLLIAKAFGTPKTAAFGLFDLIGIDLVPKILASLQQYLPLNDALIKADKIKLIDQMIEQNLIGRKGTGGFYRLKQKDETKIKEILSYNSISYRPASKKINQQLTGIKSKTVSPKTLFQLSDESPYAQFLQQLMAETLSYVLSIAPEISTSLQAIDQAIETGYQWKKGPFALMDEIGIDKLQVFLNQQKKTIPKLLKTIGDQPFYRLSDDQSTLTYRDYQIHQYHPVLSNQALDFDSIKRTQKPLLHNQSTSLYDLGNSIFCLELHSKMNAIGIGTLKGIRAAIRHTQSNGKGLIIYSHQANFSVGANLMLILIAMKLKMPFLVDWMVHYGQETYQMLQSASFPTLSAVSGLALGGGCELAMHTDAIQAHSETYMGLVETGVGLIPAWGGTQALLSRHLQHKNQGPMAAVMDTFETILSAKVSSSAYEAKQLGFLVPDDSITRYLPHLLQDAKEKMMTMIQSSGSKPSNPSQYPLTGIAGFETLSRIAQSLEHSGTITSHEHTIALQLATILTGQESMSPHHRYNLKETLLPKERTAFQYLVRTPLTLERIKHILKTGKPLRN